MRYLPTYMLVLLNSCMIGYEYIVLSIAITVLSILSGVLMGYSVLSLYCRLWIVGPPYFISTLCSSVVLISKTFYKSDDLKVIFTYITFSRKQNTKSEKWLHLHLSINVSFNRINGSIIIRIIIWRISILIRVVISLYKVVIWT